MDPSDPAFAHAASTGDERTSTDGRATEPAPEVADAGRSPTAWDAPADPGAPSPPLASPSRPVNVVRPSAPRARRLRGDRTTPSDDPAATRLRPGDVPASLMRRYFTETIRGGATLAFYEGPGAKRAAFHDHGDRLAADQTHPTLVRDLTAIALHRGWRSLRVTGEDDFRREVWMQARALGLEVKGYKPRERDQQELDRRASPVPAGPSRPDRSAPAPITPPTGPRRGPEARLTGRLDRGVVGVLQDSGVAPYRRRPGQPKTPFVRLARRDGQTLDIWGAGLPAALARADARPGDLVRVTREDVERLPGRAERDGRAEPGAEGRRAAGRGAAGTRLAERFRSAVPAAAARDPELAGAQSHLAVLNTVIDHLVSDPGRRAQLRREARKIVADELAQGRKFTPARVREIEPVLARDVAAARAREAADHAQRR